MAGLTFTCDPMNRLTELSMPPIAVYKYTLGLTGNRTNATGLSGCIRFTEEPPKGAARKFIADLR
jgi:hypothetical protein